MKNIANIFTASRIILSGVLLFLSPLSVSFFIIYAICGFTDMIDGMVARKFNSTSRFGALFDSVADIFFVLSVTIRLLPVIYLLFPKWWIYPIILIVAVKLASLIIGFIKFSKPCFFHTYLNKIAGGFVFVLPFFHGIKYFPIVLGIICTVAFVAAADEFVCMLKMKEYDADCKGFIF